MAEGAEQRVRAFEGFIELVTQRGPAPDYLARVRKTLDPFLKDPRGHVVHVDLILRVYGLISLGAHARPMRRMLVKPLRSVSHELSASVSSLPAGQVEADAVGRLCAWLADLRGALESDPNAVRRALDAFLIDPEQHSGPVDSITRGYVATWLAAQFPLTRPLLPRIVGQGTAEWRASLEQQLITLRQRRLEAAAPPVLSDIDFGLVRPLELTDGYEAWADRYRAVVIAIRLSVAPEQGFRLRELTFQVAVDSTVRVETARAEITEDGTESKLVARSTREHALSDGRDRTAKIGLDVTAPLGIGAALSFERRSNEIDSVTERKEMETAIKDGMRVQAYAKEGRGIFNVAITPERMVAPGDGGHELAASMTVTALVPLAAEELQVKWESQLTAGLYEGRASGERRLELPPRPTTAV